MKFPNDIRILYYSCILFEQENSNCEKILEHILFWENELQYDTAFETLLKETEDTGFSGWPTEIAIEASTYCNAKCKNCTHEKLIESGNRVQSIVNIQTIFYRIRKCKLITLLFHVNVSGGVSPVGLGEPLIHPDIIQIISYMKLFFPVVGINTNASLLSDQLARQIIKTNLDYIYLSLSYFDKEIYEREIGLNYDVTVRNICNFLEIRKKEKSCGKAIIHIFDNSLNSNEDIKRFKDKFRPLLQKQDALEIRQYIEFVKNETKTRVLKRNDIKPCYELWQVLMVDVDGNLYPCCMGLWKETDQYLVIGNIKDSIVTIIEQLKRLRNQQFEGNFDSCLQCGTLKNNLRFRLPLFCYDKEASIHGEIQYKKCIMEPSQFFEIEKQLEQYDLQCRISTE